MKYYKMLMLLTLVAAGLAAGCSDDEDPLKDWTGPSKPGTEIKTPAEVGNRVVAHRGGSTEAGTRQFPDNSVAALNYAIGLGCYASECDIYLTKDDDVVVAHASAGCYINNLKPWEHTLAELRAAGTLANGEQLPSLADFIDVVLEAGTTRLWLDVKNITIDGKSTEEGREASARACEIPFGHQNGIFGGLAVEVFPQPFGKKAHGFIERNGSGIGLPHFQGEKGSSVFPAVIHQGREHRPSQPLPAAGLRHRNVGDISLVQHLLQPGEADDFFVLHSHHIEGGGGPRLPKEGGLAPGLSGEGDLIQPGSAGGIGFVHGEEFYLIHLTSPRTRSAPHRHPPPAAPTARRRRTSPAAPAP